MLKRNILAKFLLLLVGLLLIAFMIHLKIIQDSLVSGKFFHIYRYNLVSSYTVNALLAATIFIVLYTFRQKLKNQIGFLFIGGSLLKFIVFFLFFYPTYKGDGEITSQEFATFFVPYALALVLETYFTVQLLKMLEAPDKKSVS